MYEKLQDELKRILAGFERGGEEQFAQHSKEFKDELPEIARKIEEFLGLEGCAIEGQARTELMLFIAGLLVPVFECDGIVADLSNENQVLQQELEGCRERERLQDELLGLYRELQAAKDVEKAELLERIEQLTQRIDELGRKAGGRSKGSSTGKTHEQQKKELKARIARCEARFNKLMQEMARLENEGPEAVGFAGGSADEDGKENDAPAIGSYDANGQPNGEDGKDGEEPDAGCEAEAAARIKELEQQLDELKRKNEELNYGANKNNDDSNMPSGKMAPWATAKSGKTSHRGQESANGTDEMARQEEESEKAALHDPNKSPFATSTGKRGKPPGSAGGGRTMPEYDERRVHYCIPEKCEQCPLRKTCGAFGEATRESEAQKAQSSVRKVYDVEIKRILTEHRIVSCTCPESGQPVSGEFPDGVNSWFQYGNGLKTLVATLSVVGMVSYERIADIIRGMIGDSKFCALTACKWVEELADKVRDVGRYIKAGVFSGSYLNSDESGVKVKGVLHWVHVACNMTLTYMRVDRKRGDEAMERIGVLPEYMGTIITDCWASYWDKGSRHGLCNAHLLRELNALVKFFPRDKCWAQKMFDLLMEINNERTKLIEQGIDQFPQERIDGFLKRYDDIVDEGLAIHPDSEAQRNGRGRGKKQRGRNLLDRLKERKENVLLFMYDEQTPFTNNSAEASLRLFAVKRSVVGGFDTYEGADDFALIWSYVSSARKRGMSAYCAIRAAMEGKAVEYLFDEAELGILDEVEQNLSALNLKRFMEDRENDKKAVLEAREEAQQKQAAVDEAKIAASQAEKAWKQIQEETATCGSVKEEKRLKRAESAFQKALDAVAKKVAAAEKAKDKAVKLYEYAKSQADSAIYFLEIEDLEWDFDEFLPA